MTFETGQNEFLPLVLGAGQLAAIKEGGCIALRLTYDHNGLRATKWAYGAETHYTYNGTKLTHLKNEVKNVQMHFYYDAQGRASLVRYNGVDYAYAHNLQGDVVRLIDIGGVRVKKIIQYASDIYPKAVKVGAQSQIPRRL